MVSCAFRCRQSAGGPGLVNRQDNRDRRSFMASYSKSSEVGTFGIFRSCRPNLCQTLRRILFSSAGPSCSNVAIISAFIHKCFFELSIIVRSAFFSRRDAKKEVFPLVLPCVFARCEKKTGKQPLSLFYEPLANMVK